METKVKKIPTIKLLNSLRDMGISHYVNGTLSKGGVDYYDYYKTDDIKDEDKSKLLEKFPSLEFFNCKCSFAPELKSILIASPKAARLKILNNEKKS